ncbi:MAG TPA: STAS domain-containing protein [Vicinamibacteria bacterium]
MKLDLREKDGVAILVLSGQLTGGGGDEEFREAIDTLLASGRNRILVDFRDVTFMDSAGMGELVSGHRTVERFGGTLKLLNPSKRVHNSLTMSKLLPIFEVFEDEDKAVASFPAASKE